VVSVGLANTCLTIRTAAVQRAGIYEVPD